MSTSAFGIVHKADSGTYAAGATVAGAGTVGAAVAAKKSRQLRSGLLAQRGSKFLHAFAHKDVDGMARHLSGVSSDARKLAGIHAAVPALGVTTAALGAAALASRPKKVAAPQ